MCLSTPSLFQWKNSWRVQARTIKFEQKMQTALVKFPIGFEVISLLPSRLNLNWKFKYSYVHFGHKNKSLVHQLPGVMPIMPLK